MTNEYRCYHSRTPEEQEAAVIDPDVTVEGVVACEHVYGLGVYVPAYEFWGHVNVTAMGLRRVRDGFADYPATGAHLHLRVLGRTPNGQLRLALI